MRNLPTLIADAGFSEKVKDTLGHGSYPLSGEAIDTLRRAGCLEGSELGSILEEGKIEGSKLAHRLGSSFTGIQDGLFLLTRDMEEEVLKMTNPEEYQRQLRYRRYYATRYVGGSGCACACAGGGR